MTAKERKAYHRRWFLRRSPEQKARDDASRKRWTAANPEKIRATIKRFRQRHPRRAVEAMRRWQRNHPEAVSLLNRRRKALRRARLHPELDKRKERAICAECRRLTRATGRVHHVDHIIPLDLGGWHHHDNLQPMLQRLNILKSNNPLWEKKGYKSWRDVPRSLWPATLVGLYLSLS